MCLHRVWWIATGLYGAIAGCPTSAQIIPDRTLPNNSVITDVITLDGSTHAITGGTQAGANLFHSFQQFSIPTANIAVFNNALNIQNILTRVTGKEISMIDGILKAHGTANLFLINPNGIIFGKNARLDIGGSFVASTADRIHFADGLEFGAVNSGERPLLSVSIPVGLQLGATPGGVINRSQPVGLTVTPGKTLALVSPSISLEGGNLTAPGGRIELGAPDVNSVVRLIPVTQGFALEYQNVQNFGGIHLSQSAMVDTSGNQGIGSGNIHLQGKDVTLVEDSRLLSLNFGMQSGGAITVNASESVEVTGTGNYARNLLRFSRGTFSATDKIGGFFTSNFSSGAAGEILVNTRRFVGSNGAGVNSGSFGVGRGGDLTLNASESVTFSTFALGTTSVNAGNAGNLTIDTGDLLMQDGAFVSSAGVDLGQSGDITVRATSFRLIGGTPIEVLKNIFVNTGLNAGGPGIGNAGNILIETKNLRLERGAEIVALTSGAGNAGAIAVKATNIELSGLSED